jgi:hypothetical protein
LHGVGVQLVAAFLAGVLRPVAAADDRLGSILQNRFGRNLQITPNLVAFEFVGNYDLMWLKNT